MNHSPSWWEDEGFAITPIHLRSEEKGVSETRMCVYSLGYAIYREGKIRENRREIAIMEGRIQDGYLLDGGC
jgi:hypothetical protein